MNKKIKIVVSIVACLIIIGAISATVTSYVVTSKIAKKIEKEYNSAVSLILFDRMKGGNIKCSGGMSVNCNIDNITLNSYREEISLNDININLKGSKTRAKIAFGFNLKVDSDNNHDYSSFKKLSHLNDTHISCEYEGKLITDKSLLKNDLLCQVKDADKNIYTYNVNTNSIGEMFKDTDFVRLTLAEDGLGFIGIWEGIDGVYTYLNSINFKTKIVNDNNLIDKYVRALSGEDFDKKVIGELKDIEKNEEYKKATEEEKQLLQLAKEFFINNHKNINIKLDAVEENNVKFGYGDFLGISLLIFNKFEGIKLITSAK